ncbi:MAG: elongation factor G [Bacteroides sp.]
MKTYETRSIRNVTLLGSTDSGKTILTEAMMLEGKLIDRKGTIAGKNTVSDYTEIEQLNQKSIYATPLYTEFMDCKLNIIDTPGADDFVGAVLTALRVSATALMVVNAQHGVEVGTEILARWVEQMHKPMIIALNQLDHEKANYEHAMESLVQSFGNKVVAVQYPVKVGAGFDSFIDVLLMKMYKFTGDTGQREELPIPESEMERAKELHGKLIEAAAENDEKLMELYFEKGSLTEDEIRKGLSAGLALRSVYPVFCVSGLKNIGVKRLMEFIIKVGPSPLDTEVPKNEAGQPVPPDVNAPLQLFVFKTTFEPHIGEVNYFKVMSGKLTENADLLNLNTQTKERFAQIFVAMGKNRTKVSELLAGDIGCTVKLKNTKSGQTLVSGNDGSPFLPFKLPNDKFRVAVKPVNEAETEKLGELLNRMHQEDLTINVEFSKELKQIIVSGQGEHHLNTMKWLLTNVHKCDVEFVPPRIPYRETITKVAQADYRHKKQSGGAGQFGEVHLVIEPYEEGMPAPTKYKVNGKEISLNIRDTQEVNLDWGGKLIFYNCIVGGAIDARFLPAIMKGIMEKMEQGPLTGSYARDIRVAVYDGKMHPVDSNEISFKLAGRNAFRAAFKEAGPKIMEPIYDLEVLVPSDYMGDVMSDLQNRRAVIMGMDSDKGFERIQARVPLAEVGRYSTALSSLTGGRATYMMKFSGYEQVPADVQEKLLKAYQDTEEE